MYAGAVIRAVVFDVGECLVNETTEYGTWADWLGFPRHTFHAVFGAVIAQGRDYRETFQEFRLGFDLEVEREKRARAGRPESFGEADLYPDVREALAGYEVPVLPVAVCQRVAFAESAAQGSSVLELDGNSLASKEVNGLVDALLVFAKT